MSPETLISLMLKVSIMLMVFAAGVRLVPHDTTHLLREPRLFIRSVVSMNIIMPLFAVVLVASFDLHPPVKIALVMLSVSPVPPLLPMKVLKSLKVSSYIFSLLVTEAVLAILFVPISVVVFGKVFGRLAYVSPLAVGIVVLITVLAPIGAGIFVGRIEAALAEKMVKPILLIATMLLACSVIPVLFIAMPAIVSLIGNGTLAAITVFVLVGLGAGHLLGGPERGSRIVLALATASRHPAVALAVAGANFSGEKLVLATLLLYLIVNAVVSIPYLVWQRRQTFLIGSADTVTQ